MMWIGLSTCYPPLGALFSQFPPIGNGRMNTTVAIMAAVALWLSTLILLISWIAYNIGALVLALAVPFAVGWLLIQRRSRTQPDESVQEPSESQEPSDSQEPLKSQASSESQAPSDSQAPPEETSRRRKKTLPLPDSFIRKPSTGGDDEKRSSWKPESEEKDTAPPQKPKSRETPSEIKFACEGCGLRYTVPASYGGRKARCHRCDHKFYMPLISLEDEPEPTVFDSSSE